MIVLRLDSHHARLLGGAEADREERSEADRNLAEHVARQALAEDAGNPVDVSRRLDAPVEHREERALGAFLGGELARDEVEVCSDAREPLARVLVEALEDLDRANLLCRDHWTTLISCAHSNARFPPHRSGDLPRNESDEEVTMRRLSSTGSATSGSR